MRKAILIVCFGTGIRETEEKTFLQIKHVIQAKYTDSRCYYAWSSEVLRKIAAKRDGRKVLNLQEALEQMKQDDVTHVVVQPVYMVRGKEYEQIVQTVNQCKEEFEEIRIGAPLLNSSEDLKLVAEEVWKQLQKQQEFDVEQEEKQDQAYVLIGHGTDLETNIIYEEMNTVFEEMDHSNVFVETMKGIRTDAKKEMDPVRNIVSKLEAMNAKEVLLLPFMISAGTHIQEYMSEDVPESWYSLLTEKGYQVSCCFKGLGEYEGVQELFAEHIADVY